MARNRTETASTEGGETAGGAGRGSGAVGKKQKKGTAGNITGKKVGKTEENMQKMKAMTAKKTKTTQRPNKMQKTKGKRRKTGKMGGKEPMQVGVPKIAQKRTGVAQGRSRLSRGQRSE